MISTQFSIKRKAKIYLHKFDLFQRNINLFVNKQEHFTTSIGSLTSIFILFFTIYSFASMLDSMFKRENPNIVSSVEYSANPPVIFISI